MAWAQYSPLLWNSVKILWDPYWWTLLGLGLDWRWCKYLSKITLKHASYCFSLELFEQFLYFTYIFTQQLYAAIAPSFKVEIQICLIFLNTPKFWNWSAGQVTQLPELCVCCASASLTLALWVEGCTFSLVGSWEGHHFAFAVKKVGHYCCFSHFTLFALCKK